MRFGASVSRTFGGPCCSAQVLEPQRANVPWCCDAPPRWQRLWVTLNACALRHDMTVFYKPEVIDLVVGELPLGTQRCLAVLESPTCFYFRCATHKARARW